MTLFLCKEYARVCVCACVRARACVCNRREKREREREREIEKDKEGDSPTQKFTSKRSITHRLIQVYSN